MEYHKLNKPHLEHQTMETHKCTTQLRINNNNNNKHQLQYVVHLEIRMHVS